LHNRSERGARWAASYLTSAAVGALETPLLGNFFDNENKEYVMKKLLISSLIFGSLAVVVPSASAAPTDASVSADPQIRVQIGNQRGRRNIRRTTRTYTRIVGYGRNRVRETVRVTYLPNGRTRTTVISRTRIGRNW
jgi:hypothetical protein